MRKALAISALLCLASLGAWAASIEGSGILASWSIVVDDPGTFKEDVFCRDPYADQRTHTLTCEAQDDSEARGASLSGRGRLFGWRIMAGEEICRNPVVEGYRIKCEYVDYRRPY